MAKLKAKVPARPRVPPLPALPSLQELKDRSAFERLLYSIREVESQHDRAAFNPRSGARGSMQIIPEVHEAGAGYGVPLLPTGASPEQMEAHGRVYFERLLGAFGNARDAAIAYNWGPTNARNWIKSGRKVEALPKETRDYVARISNFYQRESSLPLDEQMPKGRVLRREEIPPPPPQPAPSVLGAPPQTAAQPSPVEPSPVKPSPVPPFVAPEEEQFDWMGPAMGGSPPVREPRAANRERDAAAALALLEQARRFLPPGPRPVAFAEGGAVRVPEGEPDEMTSGVGSLAGRAREMFRVEPLDYRPAARGARAAAERLGEELSAPGRVPAPDTRQRLERMARDALEAGKVAGEIGYELTVPGDLTDVALMALMGPGGRLMKTGIGAALMALDPEEAEAGKIKALQEAAAKIRRSALPAEKRATRALSKKPPVVDPVEESPYPGVFGMSPAQKAAEASTRVEQESPWLKTLFGVTRDDLYEISKRKGDRPGEIAEVDNPRGSGLAYQVMTERNAQRLQDELAEAQKYPAMFRPMHAWYVMDPAYQRLLQIMPKNEADAAYARMNSFVASASPMSEPVAEIPRGLAANMMENEGLFDIFRKVGGKEAGKRVEALRSEGLSDEEVKRVLDKVPGLERFPGHSAHMTHAEMMGKLRGNEYKVISDSPKVRVYSQASGVAEHPYGFQTDSLIADAGLTRNMGFAEISRSKTPGDSLGNAPYRDIRPWWANKVAGPMGMEGVQAQAVNWATSSPATGVGTSLGSTKLELLARYIGQRATELGVDPIVFRDLVLRGKAFANGGEVHSGVGSLAAKARDMTRRAV